MRSTGATMERPTTAASSNRKLIDLENELKNEKKCSKKLLDEVDALKKEIHKQNFSSFTQNTSEVSVSDGRLPLVPGVREITLDDLQFGE
jgi:hypothetical protein